MSNRNFKVLLFLTLNLLIIFDLLFIPKFKNKISDGNTTLENFKKINFIPDLINKPTKTNLILTGDVMLGRSVMTKSYSYSDFSYPFRKAAELMKKADVVFINLEAPITSDCPLTEVGMKLCASSEMIEGLVFSGVDVANIANNHSHDWGDEGLNQTIELLNEKGIKPVGYGRSVIIKKGEVKFGFVGFDFVSSGYQLSKDELSLVKEMDRKADVLVAGVHWGSEYRSEASNEQKKVARELIEAGVDVIAGHHPHWVQGFEEIEGKPVFYSLGNFIFDQMWSEKTREGMLVNLYFEEGKLKEKELFDIYMKNWAQPEIFLEKSVNQNGLN